ncbi:transposase [Candidatus Nitrotoga sp. M5]|uniref:transposase n=1 Tax=Candidatus Nitrotoga sp. M5 TaxID=2890409 RepID=UPI001EF3BEDA|nr:transposase [Candidatus Nitrotoga sp. M5]CAH1386945.1 hypothetical protein NTGM5_400009 [Candidatus Nitrotoga sp. M5]
MSIYECLINDHRMHHDLRSTGTYLAHWGTPKVDKNAYEQSPSEAKVWLAKHQDEIEVFYLPGDSPVLNLDEMLNADFQQVVRPRNPPEQRANFSRRIPATCTSSSNHPSM